MLFRFQIPSFRLLNHLLHHLLQVHFCRIPLMSLGLGRRRGYNPRLPQNSNSLHFFHFLKPDRFSTGPPQISLFFFCCFPSLGGFLLNFGGVSEGRGSPTYLCGLSGSSCETPAAPPDQPPALQKTSIRPPTYQEKTSREKKTSGRFLGLWQGLW